MRKRQWMGTAAATLCLIVVALLPPVRATRIKMAITQFFSPLLSVATHARQAAERHLSATRTSDELAVPTRELEELRQENARLRALLAFAPRTPWKLQAARVIGRDASNWWKTILLDRGSADGVKENMAVLVPAGLVGKTTEIGPHVSRVWLISDPNCKVSSLLQQSRDPAIVEGVGASSESRPRCQMSFITRDAQVKAGDWALASGLGGVFPKGGIIGQVESVASTGLYQNARIRPAADLARLEEVFIVIGGR